MRNLQYASAVRSQLADLCQRCKIPSSSCGQNVDQVRKCLVTGLFMNIAELQRERQYLTVSTWAIFTLRDFKGCMLSVLLLWEQHICLIADWIKSIVYVHYAFAHLLCH